MRDRFVYEGTKEEDMTENSDIGRDPRFPSGWWIVPLFIVSIIMWALIALLVFG